MAGQPVHVATSDWFSLSHLPASKQDAIVRLQDAEEGVAVGLLSAVQQPDTFAVACQRRSESLGTLPVQLPKEVEEIGTQIVQAARRFDDGGRTLTQCFMDAGQGVAMQIVGDADVSDDVVAAF